MTVYNDNGGVNRPMTWAYWVTGISGILLFIAPWVLGYSLVARAFWTSLVLGGLIAIFSFIRPAVADRGNWVWWLVGILGILAIIAPFVLAFAAYPGALWACVILGAIVVIVAAIAIFSRPAAAV